MGLLAVAKALGIDGVPAEFLALYENSIFLRNRKSGEYAVLVLLDTFHRSGMQLGSGGCMDTDGSFGADFCETEDAFIGHRIENARVLPELVTYPKSEWQEIVREGGGVAVYSYVFNCSKPESLAELPEDTSLQRTLKRMYMDGGCIYIVGGYVPIDTLCIY